jgi:hypothetical protein
MRSAIVYIIVSIFLVKEASSQHVVFLEDFEMQYKQTWKELEGSPGMYDIGTYWTNEKGPVAIYSNRKGPPYEDYYAENSCPDPGNELHGFYAGIIVYHKDVPSDRNLIVIRLDSSLQKGRKYNFSCDVKYHQFAKYQIDSLQILLAKEEKDIKAWLAEKPYSGMYLNLSLEEIDNKVWKKIGSGFTVEDSYNYLVIGNLKTDNATVISKKSNCNVSQKQKGFKDYSELFLDDITITAND